MNIAPRLLCHGITDVADGAQVTVARETWLLLPPFQPTRFS